MHYNVGHTEELALIGTFLLDNMITEIKEINSSNEVNY